MIIFLIIELTIMIFLYFCLQQVKVIFSQWQQKVATIATKALELIENQLQAKENNKGYKDAMK